MLIAALLLTYLIPAAASGDRLDAMHEEERPNHCIGRSDHSVTRPASGGQQAKQQGQAKGGAEAASRQNQQNDVAACLSAEQVAVASRANVIAIEAARSSVAGFFVAYLAAIISIVSLLAVLFGSRRAGEAFLVVEFVPNTIGGDAGTLRVHNRGMMSVLLDTVMINRHDVVRSASSDGLVEVVPGAAFDHPVALVDRGGSRCFIDFKTLAGDDHEVVVHLKRNTGGWNVADVKQQR